MRFLLLLLLLLPDLAFAAASNTATTSRDSVTLVSATNTATNGHLALALHFQIQPGWHIYWQNPGDAGLPPQISLAPPPASAGPFIYPPPQFFLQNGVAAYVLSGDVLLPFTASGAGASINATAHWLICSDICVPEHADLSLRLPGGPSAEAALFKPPTIAASPFAASIGPDGTLHLAGLTPAQVATARFFPASPNQIINNAGQPMAFSNTGVSIHLTLAPGFNAATPLTGVLELTDHTGAGQALSITATPGTNATPPIAVWLGLAFLGGLILNLMPCVFPILALKVFSISRLGGGAARKIRGQAFAYTAGVLTAMLAFGAGLIVLRSFGAAIGWGFQLQSPIFIAAMALLILAIALNLAGAFSLPTFFANRLAAPGSFVTGLLAVAVATPCTAPFMGGAIAAALIAPLPAALGIFCALGLGLAAPFLLIALIPATARLLPRPGAWMLTLQRLLAIPMFATFLWLAWVFTTQLTATPLPRIANSQPYTAARLATLRAAGTPVFIDITAAWCLTCLVNERSTLANPTVQTLFTKTGTKLLIGDWTNRSAAITTFLQANNRDGVPLYVYYPRDAPLITFPQILTPKIVEDIVK